MGVRSAPAQVSFARVGALLESFLQLQAQACLIPPESAATMREVVEWLVKADAMSR